MILRKKFCFTALLVLSAWFALSGAADAADAAGVPPFITTSILNNGIEGVSYYQTLNATGDTPISWEIASGFLPHGLFHHNGVISGTPTTPGKFDFTVKATNEHDSAQKNLSITIDFRPTITTNSLPTGYLEWYYNENLHVADGTQSVTWTITSGRLPRGLVLYSDSGVISGRPTLEGRYSFTVRARNRNNNLAYDEKNLSITIRENYLWDSGCNASAGCAAAIALLMGIGAALGRGKKKNGRPESPD